MNQPTTRSGELGHEERVVRRAHRKSVPATLIMRRQPAGQHDLLPEAIVVDLGSLTVHVLGLAALIRTKEEAAARK